MTELLPVLAMLAVAGALYGLGVRRVSRRASRRVLPPVRVACFALALIVTAGALIGPLDEQADSKFSAHMIQHVLLILVAAPLFAVATPITVLVIALPATARRHTTTPVLRSRTAKLLLAPLFGFASFVFVLWGSHLPAVYDAAVANQGLHDLEHLLYLLTAFLFWSAIFGFDIGPSRLAHPARVLYLFLSMAAMAVLGLALSSTDHALYPHYVDEARAAGFSAVSDQHTGGVIMWLTGMVVMVPAMAFVVVAWMNEDERRTVREDARRDAEMAKVSPVADA